jgi:hypothetical protein
MRLLQVATLEVFLFFVVIDALQGCAMHQSGYK